jgi:hypothetical protein
LLRLVDHISLDINANPAHGWPMALRQAPRQRPGGTTKLVAYGIFLDKEIADGKHELMTFRVERH